MKDDLLLDSYHYHLPENLIAQQPANKRDNSRLLVLQQNGGGLSHRHFSDIVEYISEKDLLVVNATRVFPARLLGRKETGGKIEIFLLEYPKITGTEGNCTRATAPALIKASKKPRPGSRILLNKDLSCTICEETGDGKRRVELQFPSGTDLSTALREAGKVPLPPYIERKNGNTETDRNRYQTVYANAPGAVAAPTAGLHFTEDLLDKIRQKGCQMQTITLHVGYGTFAPVREKNITRHQIHSEYVTIPRQTVEKIKQTKKMGGKIWAVGTTTVRGLEFAARGKENLQTMEDWCDLYIYPGFEFKVVDNLITNFHLPNSSLMFLVSALCGRKQLLECYKMAVQEKYRFFSYGDAMAIIRD